MLARAVPIALVALLVGLPQKGMATGPEFIQEVCLDDKPVSEAICIGYISGVADTESENGKFCLPLHSSNDVLVSVVTEYMRRKPSAAESLAALNYNGSVLVGIALSEKFPCE